VNWSGCYVNGGGYGMWNQDHFTETFPAPSVALSSTTTTGGRGWFGVVGGGCDYQFTALQHNFVVGVLADYDFMSLSGTFQDSAIGFGDTERERSAWAAGGRVGYLVTPSVLTYVNGGYTQSRFDQVNYSVLFIPPPAIASGSSIPANTYRGWFIGGGTELALEWFPGLFWRNEYRYASYSSADLPIAPGPFLGPGAAVHADKQVQTVSTELVYKLNWSGQSGSAAAANFPIKAPPLSAPTPYWTGCYIAGGGGYGMWNDDHFTDLHRDLAGSLHPNFIDRHDRRPRLVRYCRRRLRLSIQRAQREPRGWRIRRL
jgi:outer membrane immunogenic protein